MRIGGIGGTAIDPPRRRSDETRAPADHSSVETATRAVIAVPASGAGDRPRAQPRHPSAPFLAQLIATRMHAPQTRARRRAEPAAAIGAYGASALRACVAPTLHRQA